MRALRNARTSSASVRSRWLSSFQATSNASPRRISRSVSTRSADERGRHLGVDFVLDRLHEILIDAEGLVDLRLDLPGNLLVLVQIRLRVVAALAQPLVRVGEER